MGTIILGLLKQKAAGKLIGMVASKTVGSATAGSVAGIVAALPAALGGDKTAIGAIVVIVLGWFGTLIGRLKAKISKKR